MDQHFVRLVELLFTAYAVPALLVPIVWLARRIGSSWFARQPGPPRGLTRAGVVYGALALGWAVVWAAVHLGVPIEKGGSVSAVLCWTAYVSSNLALAWLLVRFTADYGSLPEGEAKDRIFLRLLGAVVAQPVMTALAFSLLYRIMGIAYHLQVPALTAVQEGI